MTSDLPTTELQDALFGQYQFDQHYYDEMFDPDQTARVQPINASIANCSNCLPKSWPAVKRQRI